MKKLISVFVEPEDIDLWKEQAKLSGTTLSEWIRQRCNEVFLVPAEVAQEMEKGKMSRHDVPPISGIEERKPCKHGMLFCKKCK